jgi:hypothetical protein
LAAHAATCGNVVVNAHHEMFALEPLGVEVLKLANGQRRRSEILDELAARAATGAITFDDPDKAAMTPGEVRATLDRELERTLASLTRSAVLVE